MFKLHKMYDGSPKPSILGCFDMHGQRRARRPIVQVLQIEKLTGSDTKSALLDKPAVVSVHEALTKPMKRSLCITLLLCVAIGCGKGGDEPADKAEPPKPVATVASQAKVTVIETDGKLAKVRTADGKEVFVPKVRLQERSTLDRSAEEYTHVLSAATAAYETAVELPKPQRRPTKDVAIEQLNVNQLYLSERTMTEVIAPARFMAPWDEELGERCFPALTCENPDCPGEPGEGRPYLFIVRYSPGGSGGEIICPACAEAFDSANWTDEERVQYRKWVKPYRLPEQAARLKQLDDELKASARASRASPHRDVAQDAAD